MIAVWLVGWNKEKRKKSPHPSDVCVMNVPHADTSWEDILAKEMAKWQMGNEMQLAAISNKTNHSDSNKCQTIMQIKQNTTQIY